MDYYEGDWPEWDWPWPGDLEAYVDELEAEEFGDRDDDALLE